MTGFDWNLERARRTGFDWELEEARRAERRLMVKELAALALVALLIVIRQLWLV